MKWTVLVDGSAASGRAFDAVVSFLCAQNGRGGNKDELSVLHAFDPKEDAKKPYYLQGQRILNAYNTSSIRARRQYDGAGPQKLKVTCLHKTFSSTDEPVQVARLEYFDSGHSTESAPPIVACLLNALHHELHPDFLFVGSHGSGGEKVGAMGTVSEYLIRLCNATVFILKHWRRLPKLGEPVTFVVALDDSPASMKALAQVCMLAKSGDEILGLTVSRHQGPKDVAVMDQANEMIKAHTQSNAKTNVFWRELKMGAGTAAEHICQAAEELEADFLCLGSFNTAHGAKDRDTMTSLGSTALYCSVNAKCHAVVVKPPRLVDHGSSPIASIRPGS